MQFACCNVHVKEKISNPTYISYLDSQNSWIRVKTHPIRNSISIILANIKTNIWSSDIVSLNLDSFLRKKWYGERLRIADTWNLVDNIRRASACNLNTINRHNHVLIVRVFLKVSSYRKLFLAYFCIRIRTDHPLLPNLCEIKV